MARTVFITIVFVVFSGYSLTVVDQHGFFAAFEIATLGGWSTQVFLDLCIALAFAAVWMRHDARQSGLRWWPFALASIALGSVAVLAYATWSSWAALLAARGAGPAAARSGT
jgi:uncharacterized membrane protein SirB2